MNRGAKITVLHKLYINTIESTSEYCRSISAQIDAIFRYSCICCVQHTINQTEAQDCVYYIGSVIILCLTITVVHNWKFRIILVRIVSPARNILTLRQYECENILVLIMSREHEKS